RASLRHRPDAPRARPRAHEHSEATADSYHRLHPRAAYASLDRRRHSARVARPRPRAPWSLADADTSPRDRSPAVITTRFNAGTRFDRAIRAHPRRRKGPIIARIHVRLSRQQSVNSEFIIEERSHALTPIASRPSNAQMKGESGRSEPVMLLAWRGSAPNTSS